MLNRARKQDLHGSGRTNDLHCSAAWRSFFPTLVDFFILCSTGKFHCVGIGCIDVHTGMSAFKASATAVLELHTPGSGASYWNEQRQCMSERKWIHCRVC